MPATKNSIVTLWAIFGAIASTIGLQLVLVLGFFLAPFLGFGEPEGSNKILIYTLLASFPPSFLIGGGLFFWLGMKGKLYGTKAKP